MLIIQLIAVLRFISLPEPKLAQELIRELETGGADLVAFADLRSLPCDIRNGFPYAVSVAVALEPRIVSEIINGPNSEYCSEYERANDLLDSLGGHATRFLEERGYKAEFIPATNAGIDPETLSTRLPHKTVATRAGLGWIGKCALLVTGEYGSAVRITSVLTDAGLPAGDSIDESRCGDCRACVDVCPGRAITGEEWRVGIPRESLYNPFACRETAREWALKRVGIRDSICGICIAACPWTKKYITNAG